MKRANITLLEGVNAFFIVHKEVLSHYAELRPSYCLYLEILHSLKEKHLVPSGQRVDLGWLLLCTQLTGPRAAQIFG